MLRRNVSIDDVLAGLARGVKLHAGWIKSKNFFKNRLIT